jgi:hypothetical protein
MLPDVAMARMQNDRVRMSSRIVKSCVEVDMLKSSVVKETCAVTFITGSLIKFR